MPPRTVTSSWEASGHQMSRERVAIVTLRGEDDHLTLGGTLAGHIEDGEGMGDEQEVAADGCGAEQRPQRPNSRLDAGRISRSAEERKQRLGAPERELRGLHAAAPRARQHAADRNLARQKGPA